MHAREDVIIDPSIIWDPPELATGMVLSMDGRYVAVYEEKHYCAYCDELMSPAWGKDCPICLGDIQRCLLGRML